MGLETSYLALAGDYLTSGNVEKARECLATALRFPAAKEHEAWIKQLTARCETTEPKSDAP